MDLIEIPRVIFALIAVIGLIGLLAAAARKFGVPGMSIGPRDDRRLNVVESLQLDAKRRLLLVRRDGKEHLILLGPQSETLVEASVTASRQDQDGASAKGFEPRLVTSDDDTEVQ